MKLLKFLVLLIIFCSTATNLKAQLRSVEELRSEFHASVLDESKIPQFYATISEVSEPTALEIAYLGAAEAMMAKVKWSPLDKLKHLKLFESYLAQAIKEDMDNLEIRFLRFSIQYHIPKWLGFSGNMGEDKQKMVQGIASLSHMDVDRKFIRYIMYFLTETGSCTPEELAMIRSKITS